MRGLKIYIQSSPAFMEAKLYVFDEDNYYTLSKETILTGTSEFDSFNVVVNKRPEIPTAGDGDYFLKGPDWFIKALGEAFSKEFAPADNFQLGKIESLQDEKKFYRGLIESIIKTNE